MSTNFSEDIERIKVLRSQIYNKVTSLEEVYPRLLKYKSEFREIHGIEYGKKDSPEVVKIKEDILKTFSEYKRSANSKEETLQVLLNKLGEIEDSFVKEFFWYKKSTRRLPKRTTKRNSRNNRWVSIFTPEVNLETNTYTGEDELWDFLLTTYSEEDSLFKLI